MNNHIEEKFYKELVEMSPLKGRDMHNRPPLYDTPDEKIEEIKQFIKQALQSQRQSILEEIEKKIKELGIQTDKADTQIQNEDFNEFFSKEDAEKLIHDNLIIIKALEDIKQLLKIN